MNTEQLKNKTLNEKEYTSGQVKLHSTPPNLIFITSYKCNMKCIFCLGRSNDPDFNLDIYKNFFANKLTEAIQNADHLYYTGVGEVLLLPEIKEFLDYLNYSTPEGTKVFTTNGTPLNHDLILKFIEGNYSLQISLHTSNPLAHHLLTQTEYFGQIVKQIKHLVSLKKERNLSHPWLTLIFVITSLNILNLPDFVDFAGQLGANAVICHYLTIFKPEHIKISCFFLKETTSTMFNEAIERAEKYNMQLVLPPRFGTRENAEPCRDPWDHLLVDALGNILPCCYPNEPIGNLNNNDFMSIWNGKEYLSLRKSLIEKKPHKRCMNCFKFSPLNIDDIKSHITSRVCQKDILKNLGLEEKKLRTWA